MHDYNTILGVIELRLSKVSYDSVQKRYRIGRSGIALIMNRYKDSGLSLDDLRQMPASKVVDLIYPKENLRHKDIPLPDFEKIHEQMIQMGKHADLSFLWIDYKKEHPNGYQLAQFYKLYRDFMVDTYGTSKTSMPVERIPGEKMYIDWVGDQPELLLDTTTGELRKVHIFTTMLVVAMVLACILNKKDLRFKGFFRTMIFLPCTTSLVAYSIIFRSLFANDGLVNYVLVNLGILDKPYNFLTQPFAAKMVIILALLWRWTGYNMVFFLSGLQNIEYSVYEAAKIDGASAIQTFFKITVPLLKPTILLTAIMSTNGTLQLFDESINLTDGGPANASISMSHYIYNLCFKYVPNFGYAAAMSFFILLLVAVLAFIQMRVGDKRD